MKTEFELANEGEIVSTKSALALDEDVFCKQCGNIFTLAESNWEMPHPNFRGVKLHGMQCPRCKVVNVTYVKTPKLRRLEQKIEDAPFALRQKRRKQYQREFKKVQKLFGTIENVV